MTKLDRLTRSVKDFCSLVDRFFSHEQFHLLSLCGMINTHNAAGRMMMLNLANYAQFERELVRERTQEAMNRCLAGSGNESCVFLESRVADYASKENSAQGTH